MATATASTSRHVTWRLPQLSSFLPDFQTTLIRDTNANFNIMNFTTNNSDAYVDHTTVLPPPANCRVVTTQFTYIPWANPSNLISLETTLLIVQLLAGVLVPVMAFLGLVLNVLNGLVFYKQGLRERINLLLFSLAVLDFLVEVRAGETDRQIDR